MALALVSVDTATLHARSRRLLSRVRVPARTERTIATLKAMPPPRRWLSLYGDTAAHSANGEWAQFASMVAGSEAKWRRVPPLSTNLYLTECGSKAGRRWPANRPESRRPRVVRVSCPRVVARPFRALFGIDCQRVVL